MLAKKSSAPRKSLHGQWLVLDTELYKQTGKFSVNTDACTELKLSKAYNSITEPQ